MKTTCEISQLKTLEQCEWIVLESFVFDFRGIFKIQMNIYNGDFFANLVRVKS